MRLFVPPRPGQDLPPVGLPGWSFTRHRLLANCERAVYWGYYGSRGLGLEPGDPDAVRAFALRWMLTMPQLLHRVTGNAVYTAVREICRGRGCPDAATLIASTRFTVLHAFAASEPPAIERFWASPVTQPALREAVYGALRADDLPRTCVRLEYLLSQLACAAVFGDLTHAWARGRTATVMTNFAGPQYVWIDGTPTWVGLELAYVHQDHSAHGHLVKRATWCVTDFQTGAETPSPARERLKLAVYAHWLGRMGYPAIDDAYLGRIVDLERGVDRWYRLSGADGHAAMATIAADTQRQRALMADADAGEPLPPSRWALAADRSACTACNFLEFCVSELSSRTGEAHDATG